MLAWGAAAIVVLVVGKGVRRRARGLDAVLSSLRAYAGGVRSSEQLRVADDFGLLASAYNRILLERGGAITQAMGGELDALTRGQGGQGFGIQGTLDALWDGVVVFGPDGSLASINGAARVLLDVEDRPVGELSAADLFVGTELAQRVAAVASGKGRRTESVEIMCDRGDARTHLRLTLRPVVGDGRGAVVIVEDTTAHHVADEARAALMAHAVHELRTPLTNIRLYVEEALESEETNTAARGRALNVINHEARRLERVVTDMLSAAEIDSGSLSLQRGDVRLSQMFDELADDYKAAAADKEISLTFDLPPKLPVISGDRDKLALLVHNLIGNAVKYTPRGGAIVVRFEEQETRYVLEVNDTGIGIAPEEVEKVFDRFYRARDARVGTITGTGLGLTLAREVARLHGGDVTVDSRLDQGSTFTLWLPREERAAAAAA
ncbi:MAG: hypothetical protein DYG94_04845 [Leptolyngbya sp. PLA3]|nr:MAG: hypothetical protein EDM82_03995 [Cyanobacteria bacterium CYA]MCE7968060.1 hypothetical protein [Leptolyngbya sp. PL-A3]